MTDRVPSSGLLPHSTQQRVIPAGPSSLVARGLERLRNLPSKREADRPRLIGTLPFYGEISASDSTRFRNENEWSMGRITYLHRPASCKLSLEAIPDDLKLVKSWVGWDWWYRLSRFGKGPISPLTGDTVQWGFGLGSFEEAVSLAVRFGLAGIGFVFTEGNRIVGLDYDKCVDETTGVVDERVSTDMKVLSSYSELSPSGRGVHIFVFADDMPAVDPPDGSSFWSPEIFDTSGFLTVTGRAMDRFPKRVCERSAQLRDLLRVKEPSTKSWHGHPLYAHFIDPDQPPDILHAENGSGVQIRMFSEMWAEQFRFDSEELFGTIEEPTYQVDLDDYVPEFPPYGIDIDDLPF